MGTPSSASPNVGTKRYLRSLWLLTVRDLKVRYTTSVLGYLWSVLDPLAMAAIYWFVFTQVFERPVGSEPYVVFLLAALLPWVWFNASLTDSTRAFLKDAKLVRSTMIPRSIWVGRIVLSKGIEFLLSIPVFLVFWALNPIPVTPQVWWVIPGILTLAALTTGLGLIIAPLVVFFRDIERATKLVLRFLFYASPVVYGISNLPVGIQEWAWLNPLSGIFAMFRAGFFEAEFRPETVAASIMVSTVLLVIGIVFFRRSERFVLKEI